MNYCSQCKRCRPYFDFNKNQKTRSKLRSHCKQCSSEYNHEWLSRLMQTPQGLVKHRLCNRMRRIDSTIGVLEAERLLGCSWQQATDHLLAQLKPGETLKGMTIDLIVPFASADKRGDKEAMKRICHYTNLQLLTLSQNSAQGSRMSPTTS